MIIIRYFYKICSTLLSITYSCLAVCGMFFLVQKTIDILEIRKIYQETGQYPIVLLSYFFYFICFYKNFISPKSGY